MPWLPSTTPDMNLELWASKSSQVFPIFLPFPREVMWEMIFTLFCTWVILFFKTHFKLFCSTTIFLVLQKVNHISPPLSSSTCLCVAVWAHCMETVLVEGLGHRGWAPDTHTHIHTHVQTSPWHAHPHISTQTMVRSSAIGHCETSSYQMSALNLWFFTCKEGGACTVGSWCSESLSL